MAAEPAAPPAPDRGAGPPASLRGAELPLAVAAHRLEALGVRGDAEALSCLVRWRAPGVAERPASEASVQAELGLMQFHGLPGGQPRRLGLDVASVAAGVLASQAVLAALVGRSRGLRLSGVTTSVPAAAALLLSPALARASCDPDWSVRLREAAGDGTGPPFPTADGAWIELETLEPRRWAAFWRAMGVARADLIAGWAPLLARYATAACRLPPAFREATGRRRLGEVVRLARRHGISLARLRRREEVLAEPAAFRVSHPVVRVNARSREARPLPAVPPGTAPARPLEGLVVIEATSRIQGPLAGQLLRQLGARVLRIEPPGGDAARMVPPLAGETGALFLAMNRGKHPVEIDLRTGAGIRQLLALISGADVFLNNWRTGREAQLGLDAQSLARLNPGLVHCQASGWGVWTGSCPPLALEFQVQAHSGLARLVGTPEQATAPSPVLLTDAVGGLLACEGILAGLWTRQLTSRGVLVQTSLLAAAMALQDQLLLQPDSSAGARSPARAPSPASIRTDLGSLAAAPATAALLEEPGGVSLVRAPWRFSA